MKEQDYLKMFKEIRALNDTPEDYLKFKERIEAYGKTREPNVFLLILYLSAFFIVGLFAGLSYSINH